MTGDRVARLSQARTLAWVAEPDHLGAIALVVLAEAIIGGWTALRAINEDRTRVVHRLACWLPSPTLAMGLVGIQVCLFHRLSGWGFATIEPAMATGLVLSLMIMTQAFLLARRRPEWLVYAFAGLLLLGTAIPPLVRRPASPRQDLALDLRVLVVVALASVPVIGAGCLLRLVRTNMEGAGLR